MNPTSSTSSTTTTTTVTASASSSTSITVSSVANTPESCLTSAGDSELEALISQASHGRNEYWPEPNPEPKPVQPPPALPPRQDELTELIQELCPDITKEQMAEIFPSNPTSRAIMLRELKKARDTEDLGLMMEILNITSSCGSLRVSLEKSRSKK